MKLPDLRDFDLTGKKVLLRADLDVPLVRKTEDGRQKTVITDETRIEESVPTINHLLSKKAKVIILAHLGRPEGKVVSELSLEPAARKLQELLPEVNIKFQGDEGEIILLENLRFDPGEENPSTNSGQEFTKKLASLGDFFVNNAFACSHREHASIVGLPGLLPHAAGLDLLEEVGTLSKILENPKRPVVVILGGAKEDKLETIGGLATWADYILVGGKLPVFIQQRTENIQHREKILIADLGKDGKDITLGTIEKFEEIIKKAGTIVWSGPMGQYEIKEYESGTKMIGEIVSESSGFKVIGGGDTEAALTKFGLIDKMSYISSGGGAMLEFLANGDLPGLKALRE